MHKKVVRKPLRKLPLGRLRENQNLQEIDVRLWTGLI
jgi:hypothetical protein